jgi:hypothetical protein
MKLWKRRRWLIPVAPTLVTAFSLLSVAPAPFGITWQHATTAAEFSYAAGVVLGLLVYPLAAVCLCLWALLGPGPREVWSRHLRLAGLLGLGVVVTFAAAFADVVLLDRLEVWRNRRIALRASTVIAAIERYHADRREYPAALSQLKPTYLRRIPGTGTLTPSRYEYARFGRDAVLPLARRAPPYRLRVKLPVFDPLDDIVCGPDCLRYCSHGDYPRDGRPGTVGLPDHWELVQGWLPTAIDPAPTVRQERLP